MSVYKKEICQQELEDGIIEKIKKIFDELKKNCDNFNDKVRYNEHDLQQADQAIKKLADMRITLRNLISKIDGMKKLPPAKKTEFTDLLYVTLVISRNFSLKISNIFFHFIRILSTKL